MFKFLVGYNLTESASGPQTTSFENLSLVEEKQREEEQQEEQEKEEPSKFYILHENGKWLDGLRSSLKNLNVPFEEWELIEGNKDTIDFLKKPPKGVFYNRVSPSSHTRGNRLDI